MATQSDVFADLKKLSAIPYRDDTLKPIKLYVDKDKQELDYYCADEPEITILARLVCNPRASGTDAYQLALYLPVQDANGRDTYLVDFAKIDDFLKINTSPQFVAKHPHISARVQGPRRKPLILCAGRDCEDRGILKHPGKVQPIDADDDDAKLYAAMPQNESALYNLHAQFLNSRVDLQSWSSNNDDGCCGVKISSEIQHHYPFRVDAVRSYRRELSHVFKVAYSRDPIIRPCPKY